jgi:DNA excision repair protein ERCC-3
VPWASEQDRERYERAEGTKKLIHAAANPAKHEVVERLLEQHEEQPALVFVDWVKQGRQLSDHLDVPFVYGETDHDRREEIYEQFRAGGIDALVISRVGDEGIDLPDAELAILASTMGSSRSQTAQRVGRLMRPVGDGQAYIVLTESSGEEDWGRESTQYLTEKGIDVTRRKW